MDSLTRNKVVGYKVAACLFSFLLIINTCFSQSDCCRIPSCNPESKEFARLYSEVLEDLGPYPNDEPGVFVKNDHGKWVLNPDLNESESLLYERAICWTQKLKTQDPLKAEEIFDNIESEDVLNWWNYFNSFSTGNTQLPSPNFGKATYWMVNLRPIGVMEPYGANEGYMGSYDFLIGRTIKRNDPLKDRKLRVALGIRYQRLLKENDLLGLASIDLKLTDIQFNAFNIGLLKLHFQGFANDVIYGGEVGFGFETYGAGIQLISIGYQDFGAGNGIYLQSGFSINIAELF